MSSFSDRNEFGNGGADRCSLRLTSHHSLVAVQPPTTTIVDSSHPNSLYNPFATLTSTQAKMSVSSMKRERAEQDEGRRDERAELTILSLPLLSSSSSSIALSLFLSLPVPSCRSSSPSLPFHPFPLLLLWRSTRSTNELNADSFASFFRSQRSTNTK